MHRDAQAFLAIWNDTADGHDNDWIDWHTREHFPERVGVEGFLVGRRYVALETGDTRYFTLYEGRDISVFDGPSYLARLNDPTPWTQEMSAHFRNFVRGACRAEARRGLGDGGVALVVRLVAGGQASATIDCEGLAKRMMAIPGVTTATVGLCDHDVTLVQTRERETRSGTEDAIFDAVLIAEALSAAAFAHDTSAVDAAIRDCTPGHVIAGRCRYLLSYRLSEEDLPM